ncbi:MAG: alpha/beta fold hydrolase [Patescibacteria group bacterium]
MENVLHRWLKIPYTLHTTEFLKPKRPRATYILLHGIGNSTKAWDELIPMLPKDIRVIGIDLLGFGKSPKPNWITYNAKTQARSVGITLMKLRLFQQPTIIGHSLGSLVAVEVTRRYPLLPKQLILCSPPFYEPTADKKQLLKRDEILKSIYKRAKHYLQTMETILPLAERLGMVSKAFDINSGGSTESYLAALEASIVNQTALKDAEKLRLPITILYGTLDPVVISSHIRKLAKTKPNITAKKIVTGHEIVGRYTKFLAKEISDESL